MVRWPWQQTATVRPAWQRVGRLLIRGLLATAMWLLLGTALLAGAVLSSSAVRERLLGLGLRVATGALPGQLSLEHGAWPALGHLQLRDLVWTDGEAPGDTLAHVARLDIQLDMGALRARDVRVDSLRLVVPWLDGPAIEAVLLRAAAADTSRPVAVADSTSGRSVLRPGAVPGLPSVAVSHWLLAVQRAVLTADLTVANVAGEGLLEAGHDHEARAVIDHFEGELITSVLDSLVGHPVSVALSHLGLGLRLTTETDSLPGRAVAAAELDSLSVHFGAVGSSGSRVAAGVKGWDLATGPVHLRNTGHIERTGTGYRGKLTSEFELPGAAAFSALLPDSFPLVGLEQIAGSLSLNGMYSEPRLELAVDLDLGSTVGLDSGRLTVSLGGDLADIIARGVTAAEVVLDTLDFALLGSSVTAQGQARDGQVKLSLRATLADSQLVRPFLPGAGDSLAVAGELMVEAWGPFLAPQVELALAGHLHTAELDVPHLAVHLAGGAQGGEVTAELAEGMSLAGVQLDSVMTRLTVVRSDGDSLAAAITVGVWRGEDQLALGAQAWADSLGLSARRRVRVDSLVVVARGLRMQLVQPTTLTLGEGPLAWALSPLEISSEVGQLSAGGTATADDLDLEAAIGLLVPEALLNSFVPSELWSVHGGMDLTLDATAEIHGSRQAPAVGGHLSARIQPHRDEPNLGLDLKFGLAPGDTTGLQADVGLVVADSVALGGQVRLPMRQDEAGRWRYDAGLPAVVSIPDQTLGLASLNRLLPPDVSLAGDLTVGAEIRSQLAVTDSMGTVAGHLRTEDLEVRLPNRSRASLTAELEVGGTLADPTLGGRIEIVQGFFRIPELPRSLHPVEGEPLLWSLIAVDSLATGPDSLAVFAVPAGEGPTLDASGLRMLPDLDLEILIPGDLRVHGYGLDTELTGDLKVSRGVDEDGHHQPRIHGYVHTVDGTFQFMNRVFSIERGEVNFAGAVPPEPLLDLMLETTVNGVRVRILVSGTAGDPVIELTSEPNLEDQDIMGVLLFGRPLGDLDDDQRGGVQGEADPGQQLRQNLAGLAMVFGTAGLQNQMSNTFGVDMVEVGSGSEGDATLMVGKFINPKLMLKYHHSLEKSGTYFLTMEYALSRIFQLVTTYGQGEEDSGLEIKWSRRY